MKGYCKCGRVVDEVIFTQYGMCKECYIILDMFNKLTGIGQEMKENLKREFRRGYELGYVDGIEECNEE